MTKHVHIFPLAGPLDPLCALGCGFTQSQIKLLNTISTTETRTLAKTRVAEYMRGSTRSSRALSRLAYGPSKRAVYAHLTALGLIGFSAKSGGSYLTEAGNKILDQILTSKEHT